jgi:hypothetical protein
MDIIMSDLRFILMQSGSFWKKKHIKKHKILENKCTASEGFLQIPMLWEGEIHNNLSPKVSYPGFLHMCYD